MRSIFINEQGGNIFHIHIFHIVIKHKILDVWDRRKMYSSVLGTSLDVSTHYASGRKGATSEYRPTILAYHSINDEQLKK